MRAVFAILLVGSGILGAWGVWKVQERQQARHLPPAETESTQRPVSKRPQSFRSGRDVGFVGVVVAGDTVQLEAKTEGRIESLLVKSGDYVEKDAVIATTESTRLRAELTVQRAAARAASARLHRRARLARGRNAAVTSEELDSARFEAIREEDRVKALERALAETTVRAPFAGIITDTLLTAGALAGPGRPIVRLQGQSSPRVRFAVPENAVTTIKAGAPVLLRLGSNATRVPGTVVSMNPQIDPASRMAYGAAEIAKEPLAALSLSTGIVARVYVDQQRSPSDPVTVVQPKE